MISIYSPIILSKFKNYCETTKNNQVFSLLNLLGYYIVFFQQFKNITTIDEYNKNYTKMKELISSHFNSELIYIDFCDASEIFTIFSKMESLEYLFINIID